MGKGLLLAGVVYWGCTVAVLHFNAFGAEIAAAASLPGIVVQLFGQKALWVACIIGYLACFASLNIYTQSFARLVWSQAQLKPQSRLAQLSPRQAPVNALNVVLGCCLLCAVGIYALGVALDELIIYANGIFIMIYLLCMLAGCRLLKGRSRLMAAIGSVLCLLLLYMVGWKSISGLIAGGLQLPCSSCRRNEAAFGDKVVVKSDTAVCQSDPDSRVYGRCATERSLALLVSGYGFECASNPGL